MDRPNSDYNIIHYESLGPMHSSTYSNDLFYSNNIKSSNISKDSIPLKSPIYWHYNDEYLEYLKSETNEKLDEMDEFERKYYQSYYWNTEVDKKSNNENDIKKEYTFEYNGALYREDGSLVEQEINNRINSTMGDILSTIQNNNNFGKNLGAQKKGKKRKGLFNKKPDQIKKFEYESICEIERCVNMKLSNEAIAQVITNQELKSERWHDWEDSDKLRKDIIPYLECKEKKYRRKSKKIFQCKQK